MNSFTTSKKQVINFVEVDLITISTYPLEKRTVDRGTVSTQNGDIDLFAGEVMGFQREFSTWQHNKNLGKFTEVSPGSLY